MSQSNYYEILGVSQDATAEQIKRAYRKKAVQHHPDRHQGKDKKKAEEKKFKEISQAYEVLRDPEKRAQYDRYGHAAFQTAGAAGPGAGFHDPFDIFNQVFGGAGGIFDEFFGGGRQRASGRGQRGDDLRYDLPITLEEAVSGFEKELRYKRQVTCTRCKGTGAEPDSQRTTCPTCRGAGEVAFSRGFIRMAQTCPTCHGMRSILESPCHDCRGEGRRKQTHRIKVRIPAGVDTVSKLRSSGNGDAGLQGGPSGDLYVVIHVKEHDIFERDGADLYYDVPIKFTLATLGGTLEVPTLKGKATLKIPPGTQSNATFRLRGRGMPSLEREGAGDQFIRVQIEVPKKLTKDQREKLETFAIACGDADNPVSESFLKKTKRFFE